MRRLINGCSGFVLLWIFHVTQKIIFNLTGSALCEFYQILLLIWDVCVVSLISSILNTTPILLFIDLSNSRFKEQEVATVRW